MSKPKIYEAGQMSGLTLDQMNGWRKQAERLFRLHNVEVQVINPVEYYNFEMDRSTYTDKEVKEFDLWAVKNSDVILVNLDYPNSIGTAIEIHMAHDVWHKPVIAFCRDTSKVHPWMLLSCTKICETLEEAVMHIIEFYLPNV